MNKIIQYINKYKKNIKLLLIKNSNILINIKKLIIKNSNILTNIKKLIIKIEFYTYYTFYNPLKSIGLINFGLNSFCKFICFVLKAYHY